MSHQLFQFTIVQATEKVGMAQTISTIREIKVAGTDGAPIKNTAMIVDDLIAALNAKKIILQEQEAIAEITDNTLYYFPKNKWYFMSEISNGLLAFQRTDKMGNHISGKYRATELPVSSLRKVSKQPAKFLKQVPRKAA